MFSKLSHFAEKLWLRLSTAANQLYRRITEPARSSLVTATQADIPRS